MAIKNIYELIVKAVGAKKTEKELKGVNSSLKTMTKNIASVTAGYFGAQGLINGAQFAVEAFARQELAEKKLNDALGGTSVALLEQASALQRVSRFGDEAIIEQQAFLASLKFTEDQIKSIIPVAMDLSEATGITLESAVRNTAKTFSGLAGELGELVPQLRGLTKEQMMAGEAVEIMAELFGGQALSATQTYTGQVQQLQNAIGDTAEAIGKGLVPQLLKVAPTIKLTAEFWSDFLNGQLDSDPIMIKTKENLSKLYSALKILIAPLGVASMFWSKIFGGTEEEAMSKTEKRIEGLTDVLIKQELRLQEIAKTYGLYSEQYEKAFQGIEKTKQSIEDANKKEEESQSEIQKAFRGRLDATIELSKVESKLDISRRIQHEKEKKRKLEDAALSGLTAKQSAMAVIKSESMEAIVGLISSIFKSVPFPLNTILAAGAGTLASSAIDRNLKWASNKFEDGGLVGGRRHSQGGTMIEAESGEFVMSRDAVSRIGVNNLEAMNSGGSGMTINISAPLVDDTVVDSIIPKIKEAVRRGESLT
tara:strand:- start:884 stop:2494 length:1611 start_codon:yes stop_codon:yes gene_type:complete